MIDAFLRFVGRTTTLELAWISLWLGTISFTQRTATESLYGGFDSTHFQRYVFDAIALGLALMNVGRVRKPRRDPVTLFLVYALIGVISTTWSAATLPSLGKSGELFIGVIIVWAMLSKRAPLARLMRLIEWTAMLTAATLVAALIGFVVWPSAFSIPSIGVFPLQMDAPFVSANSIAYGGAAVGLFCLARHVAPPPGSRIGAGYLWLTFFFAIFPVLSQGRTGQTVFILGALLLLLRRRPGMALLLVVPPALILGLTFLGEISRFFLRGQQEAQFLGLSGRLILWQWAWESFQNHPLFGVGFGIGSRYMFAQGTGGFGADISSAHNGFLEVLLGTGLMGFAFWLPSLLWGVRLAVAGYLAGQRLDVCILYAYLIATTVMSIGVGGWMSPPPAFFLAATAYLFAARSRAVQPAAGGLAGASAGQR